MIAEKSALLIQYKHAFLAFLIYKTCEKGDRNDREKRKDEMYLTRKLLSAINMVHPTNYLN